MDLEKLGKMLREKREEIGIPPSTLAEKTGIHRPTLWIYERGENPKTGKPSRPSKDKLERLAEKLHMSQEETEELLSLADYRAPSLPPPVSPHGSAARVPVPAAPTVTEVNGVIYVANNGYLEAFDARTGEPRWPKPARLQSTAGEAAPLLPRDETSMHPPQRQETKRRRIRDTEPLSPEKRQARLLASGRPASQTELETGLARADTSRKKKRQ